MNKKIILILLVSVIVIAGGVSLIWSRYVKGQEAFEIEFIEVPSSPLTGMKKIKVQATLPAAPADVMFEIHGTTSEGYIGQWYNNDNVYFFDWHTPGYPDGTYSIEVEASYGAGGGTILTASDQISGLVVSNNPTDLFDVDIVQPNNGEIVSGDYTVKVQVNEHNTAYPANAVHLHIPGSQMGYQVMTKDSSGIYKYQLNTENLQNQSYDMSAYVVCNNCPTGSNYEDQIEVTVNNDSGGGDGNGSGGEDGSGSNDSNNTTDTTTDTTTTTSGSSGGSDSHDDDDADKTDNSTTTTTSPHTITSGKDTTTTTTTSSSGSDSDKDDDDDKDDKDDDKDSNGNNTTDKDYLHKDKTTDYPKKATGEHTEEYKEKPKKKKEDRKEYKKYAKLAKEEYLKDQDNDGLSDVDEERLGTDPTNADSDQDGFNDSEEVEKGFNPTKKSDQEGGDKIEYENLKTVEEVAEIEVIEEYVVEEVELVKYKEDEEDKEEKEKVRLAGKATPNTYITLYIYSEQPIIVTFKTDADGNWSYDLDHNNVEDGEHEVYVAVTDSTGKVQTKSEPFKFVKTAEAVAMIGSADAQEKEEKKEQKIMTQSPVEKSKSNMLMYAVGLIIGALVAAIGIIGVIVSRRSKKKYEEQNNALHDGIAKAKGESVNKMNEGDIISKDSDNSKSEKKTEGRN